MYQCERFYFGHALREQDINHVRNSWRQRKYHAIQYKHASVWYWYGRRIVHNIVQYQSNWMSIRLYRYCSVFNAHWYRTEMHTHNFFWFFLIARIYVRLSMELFTWRYSKFLAILLLEVIKSVGMAFCTNGNVFLLPNFTGPVPHISCTWFRWNLLNSPQVSKNFPVRQFNIGSVPVRGFLDPITTKNWWKIWSKHWFHQLISPSGSEKSTFCQKSIFFPVTLNHEVPKLDCLWRNFMNLSRFWRFSTRKKNNQIGIWIVPIR